MKQIDLREGARRQHRAIGLLAAVQCWKRGLDGVAFRRRDLERLLGLERFKKTRERWLTEDLREFFPFQEMFWSSSNQAFSSVIASRVSLRYLPKGTMTTEARVQRMNPSNARLGLFAMWPADLRKTMGSAPAGLEPFFANAVNEDERLLCAYLSLLASGQISPDVIPGMKEARAQPSKTRLRLVKRAA
jgi:hypothetical protein